MIQESSVRGWRVPIALALTGITAVVRKVQRHRSRRGARHLSDHMLRDIGLSRAGELRRGR
jgi:uncharacterized protein YjiS (DUF1127 family)